MHSEWIAKAEVCTQDPARAGAVSHVLYVSWVSELKYTKASNLTSILLGYCVSSVLVSSCSQCC